MVTSTKYGKLNLYVLSFDSTAVILHQFKCVKLSLSTDTHIHAHTQSQGLGTGWQWCYDYTEQPVTGRLPDYPPAPVFSKGRNTTGLGLYGISFEHCHRDVHVCNSHISEPAM